MDSVLSASVPPVRDPAPRRRHGTLKQLSRAAPCRPLLPRGLEISQAFRRGADTPEAFWPRPGISEFCDEPHVEQFGRTPGRKPCHGRTVAGRRVRLLRPPE